MKLGVYPSMSLAQARSRAGELLTLAQSGIDPKTSVIETVERRAVSVRDAVEDYLDWCARNNDAETVRHKRSALTNHLMTAHAATPLVDISRSLIVRVLDQLGDRPSMRRNMHRYLGHFFGWACDRDLIPVDPMLGLKAPKAGTPRDRVLADGEIRALWSATGTVAAMARLSLLTAQRRGSLESMRWTDIDEAQRVWSIPAEDMKSARAHRVPLSASALAELARRPRLAGPYVFGTGSDGAKPFEGSSKGARILRKQLGGPDWRLHDVRRTAVTLAQRGGASIEAIRALTQHKLPGVIGVYARHGYENEKREVVETIERTARGVLSDC
jgi:integrase